MSLRRGKLDENPWLGGNLSSLIEVQLQDLKPIPGQAWTFRKSDVGCAKDMVARFGDRALPVLVDDENHVISGEIFVEAARARGRKRLRVIRQSGLSPTEALLLGTAITKIQTLGSWDADALEAAIRRFEALELNFSAGLVGFAPGELDRIIGAAKPGPEADAVPPVGAKAVSELGSMWACGDHLVLCGDATKPEALAALLAGQKVSVAVCDPPFGCKINGFVSKKGRHREFVQASGEMNDAELIAFFSAFCQAMSTVLKAGAVIYLYIDFRSQFLLQQAAEPVFGRLLNLCVWAKDRAGMGSFYRSQHELVLVYVMPGAGPRNNIELGRHGRDRSNVWSYPSAASSRKGREGDMLRNHPTPKPVEMIAEAIIDCSLRGEIVLDCFLGSGTTLIAAERTGRTFRGMDLDPLYVDLAVRRWQAWTGKDAIDLASGRTFDDLAAEVSDV